MRIPAILIISPNYIFHRFAKLPFTLTIGLCLIATASSCQPKSTVTASPVDGYALHADFRLPNLIWLDRNVIKQLPVTGPAWERLLAAANTPMPPPDLSDQDSEANVLTLARALVYAKTGNDKYRDEVVTACLLLPGSELNGTALALAKQLAAYVLAAELVGLSGPNDSRFRNWLRNVLSHRFRSGKTLRSVHAQRPNNWGTLAGASRLAVAVYLGDKAEIRECAEIFKGWLGDRHIYSGFRFKDRSWQANPRKPVGINPVGASKNGHNIDGVLPDDQRRGGPFAWPPPKENYVYTALQGAVLQAMLLQRCGYKAWEWEGQALLRAFEWLYHVANYPPAGDDKWMVFVINRAYDASLPEKPVLKRGKNVGWTDWTHSTNPQEDYPDRKVSP